MMPLGVVRDDQILDTCQRSRQHNGLIDRCRLDTGCEIKISVIWQGPRPKQLKKNGVAIYQNGGDGRGVSFGVKKRSSVLDILRKKWVLEIELRIFNRQLDRNGRNLGEKSGLKI